jgi:hypothetical protein
VWEVITDEYRYRIQGTMPEHSSFASETNEKRGTAHAPSAIRIVYFCTALGPTSVTCDVCAGVLACSRERHELCSLALLLLSVTSCTLDVTVLINAVARNALLYYS